jgi:hypothetical protein
MIQTTHIYRSRVTTFLNIPQLERQGADIQSKVELLNQSLRNCDKLKDDAIPVRSLLTVFSVV